MAGDTGISNFTINISSQELVYGLAWAATIIFFSQLLGSILYFVIQNSKETNELSITNLFGYLKSKIYKSSSSFSSSSAEQQQTKTGGTRKKK